MKRGFQTGLSILLMALMASPAFARDGRRLMLDTPGLLAGSAGESAAPLPVVIITRTANGLALGPDAVRHLILSATGVAGIEPAAVYPNDDALAARLIAATAAFMASPADGATPAAASQPRPDVFASALEELRALPVDEWQESTWRLVLDRTGAAAMVMLTPRDQNQVSGVLVLEGVKTPQVLRTFPIRKSLNEAGTIDPVQFWETVRDAAFPLMASARPARGRSRASQSAPKDKEKGFSNLGYTSGDQFFETTPPKDKKEDTPWYGKWYTWVIIGGGIAAFLIIYGVAQHSSSRQAPEGPAVPVR
ncbi:MAG: hypothetical protein GMKNLPBB_02770 [Myxococcota bacterium]|nr:hypothetical protein [Myxococcota bacterium]